MDHRDAEIADVVVVLNEKYAEQMEHAIAMLTAAGLEVLSTDENDGVVEGSVETSKLAAIHTLECVTVVRTVLTYIADYPVGDPRNLDGDDDDEDAA